MAVARLRRHLLPTWGAGAALLLAGERIATTPAQRIACDLAGATLVVLATFVAGWRAWAAGEARRPSLLPAALGWGVALLGWAVYATVAAPATRAWWGAHAGVGAVAAAFLWLAGALPAAAAERALAAAGASGEWAQARVRHATSAALAVVACITTFGAANYAASVWPRSVDLSYFRTSSAGDATAALVRDLDQPIDVSLFFPPGNPVAAQVQSYWAALTPLSAQLRVHRLDQAVDVEQARALKVRGNGQMVISRGEASQSIQLGLDALEARHGLRRLDAAVLERLSKVARPPRVAYLTQGHNERDGSPAPDDRRPGLGDFQGLLRGLGLSVRRLGLGEGLGRAVPSDAAVVLAMGPSEPFAAGERLSLAAYVQGGGRLLVAMDPDHGRPDDALLAPFGVRVTSELVAHDSALVRVEGRGVSPHDIYTTQSSAHPMVRGLEQSRGRSAVVLLGAGAVVATGAALVPTPHLAFPLHAMAGSRLTPAAEVGALALAAAITWPGAHAGRVVVLGDADLAGDGLVRNTGNAYLLLDTVRWLIGDDAKGIAVASEEDVVLVHRQDQDLIWFWAPIVAVPAAVVAGGLGLQRRRRRPLGPRS